MSLAKSCAAPSLRLAFARRQSTVVHNVTTFPPNSTVFSLIQPTGRIHLGNYLGAISNWRDMSQNPSDGTRFLFGTADLHALTTVRDGAALKKARHEAIASLIAAGIDPQKCIVYHQSAVPQHTQLMWLLTCLTSMGALNRMTQWKAKAKVNASDSIYEDDILANTKAGIFTYPVLQAADILIYKSTHVPVGDDQSQHLELCRGIAQSFNSAYNTDFFPLPKSVLTASKKILSLRDPSKKMSKSDADTNSCVYITEAPDAIAKKIRKATTDSIQGIYFDPQSRPGVSNLINIISGLRREPVDDTVKHLQFLSDHKALKDYTTELIVEEFKDQRYLFEKLMSDTGYLDEITAAGARKAQAIAEPNMRQIEQVVGLK